MADDNCPGTYRNDFMHCMPLFIALGDEMRLSIIEVLTAEALELQADRPAPSYSKTMRPQCQ